MRGLGLGRAKIEYRPPIQHVNVLLLVPILARAGLGAGSGDGAGSGNAAGSGNEAGSGNGRSYDITQPHGRQNRNGGFVLVAVHVSTSVGLIVYNLQLFCNNHEQLQLKLPPTLCRVNDVANRI
jgi:hypothetical protein